MMLTGWLITFAFECILAILPTVMIGYLLSRKQLLGLSLWWSILIGGAGAIVLTYVTQGIGVYYLVLGALLLPMALYKGELWNIYLRGKNSRYKLHLAIVVAVVSVLIFVLGVLL